MCARRERGKTQRRRIIEAATAVRRGERAPCRAPSIANWTLAIPCASDACAVAANEPVKKPPAAGLTMNVDGGVLSTVTVADADADLPRASTIEAAIVCEPSGTEVEFQVAVAVPEPTTVAESDEPSADNCTVGGFAALVNEAATGTLDPRTKVNNAGDDKETVGYAGPTSTVTAADVCVPPPGNATDQSIAVTESKCVPTAMPAVFQAI